MKNCISIAALGLSTFLAAGCGGTSPTGTSPTPPTTPPATTPVLAIQNGGFTRNGVAFQPRGVQLRAFVATKAIATAEIDNGSGGFQAILNAQTAFGSAELAAAGTVYGANIVRIQVSQPALDPAGTETLTDSVTGKVISFYDPTYLATVTAAVNQARAAGLAVIISMQDEADTGTSQHMNLPTQATLNAWNQLLPTFGSASDVILELYNEPSLPDTAANWNLWAYGGTSNGSTFIGMQALLNDLRMAASPAKNVFFLDGLGEAATLAGIPNLSTPITDHTVSGISGQFAYAIHPYPRGISNTDTPAQYTALWGSQFGNLNLSNPVVATEWAAAAGIPAGSNLGLLGAPSYQVAVDLLNYLETKRIPLSAAAFDVPGVLVQALDGTYTPTNYNNYAAVAQSAAGGNENAGLLIQKFQLSPFPTTTLQCTDGITSAGVNGATCGQ